MLTSDFDYRLPNELIAQTPAARGESRLMDLTGDTTRHRSFRELPKLLRPGDLLVVNDTKVIPARLYGRAETGGRVEILLVEKTGETSWRCLTRPGRKTRAGTEIDLAEANKSAEALTARVEEKLVDGIHRLRFSSPVEPYLERLGHVPLPPYIKRPDNETDRGDYQTVYARRPGAIAAPTAGLHFDRALLAELEENGIQRTAITLHIGIGTFKPVTASLVHEHQMDEERYEIDARAAAAITSARLEDRRVVAVGTTVVRALEAAAATSNGLRETAGGRTDLFITPGFRFRVVDALLTNFHLPRSTLLMLVSAFAGRDRVLAAYGEAVRMGYRFYSYGDAMLALRS